MVIDTAHEFTLDTEVTVTGYGAASDPTGYRAKSSGLRHCNHDVLDVPHTRGNRHDSVHQRLLGGLIGIDPILYLYRLRLAQLAGDAFLVEKRVNPGVAASIGPTYLSNSPRR